MGEHEVLAIRISRKNIPVFILQYTVLDHEFTNWLCFMKHLLAELGIRQLCSFATMTV